MYLLHKSLTTIKQRKYKIKIDSHILCEDS